MAWGVGVIGYGQQGRWHAGHLGRQEPDFRLVGIYDPTEACRARAEADWAGSPVTIYSELDRFLADPAIELVLIATPTTSHAPLTISALESGKHVVCEKPMAMNAEEGRAMLQAATNAGRVFSVFQNRRWDGYFLQAKSAVESGYLGRIVELGFVEHSFAPGSLTYGVSAFRSQWRAERAYGGGMLYDWGGHRVDQLLLLHRAPVERVYCQLVNGHWLQEQDADNGFHIEIRFTDAVVAHVEMNTVSLAGVRTAWYISGTEGGYLQGKLSHRVRGRTFSTDWPEPTGVEGFWPNLVRVLREEPGAVQAVPPEESVRVMRVIDAAFQSHEQGQVVRFDSPV